METLANTSLCKTSIMELFSLLLVTSQPVLSTNSTKFRAITSSPRGANHSQRQLQILSAHHCWFLHCEEMQSNKPYKLHSIDVNAASLFLSAHGLPENAQDGVWNLSWSSPKLPPQYPESPRVDHWAKPCKLLSRLGHVLSHADPTWGT